MKLCFRGYLRKPKAQIKKLPLNRSNLYSFRSKIGRNKNIFIDSGSGLGKNPLQFIPALLVYGGYVIGRLRREGRQ